MTTSHRASPAFLSLINTGAVTDAVHAPGMAARKVLAKIKQINKKSKAEHSGDFSWGFCSQANPFIKSD